MPMTSTFGSSARRVGIAPPLLVILLASAAYCASPSLSRVNPPAAQKGTEAEVVLDLAVDVVQQLLEQVEPAVDVAHDISPLVVRAAWARSPGSREAEHDCALTPGRDDLSKGGEICVDYTAFAKSLLDQTPAGRAHGLAPIGA